MNSARKLYTDFNNEYDLEKADFINITCDDKFKNLLIEKIKNEKWEDIKETYDKMLKEDFEHKNQWIENLEVLNHVIITNKHDVFWSIYGDRIFDKYFVRVYDDNIIAEYRVRKDYYETVPDRQDVKCITDKQTGLEYIVSKPFEYCYV